MKQVWIAFVLLLINGFAFGQTIHQKIPGKTISANDFLEAGYITQNIPLQHAENIRVRVTDIEEVPVDAANTPKAVSTSFQPDIFTYQERKKEFLSVRIPLFRRVGNQTNRLLRYQLSLEYDLRPAQTNPSRPTGASNSVLATGSWYKIGVPKRGIFKIDYAFLQEMGLDPAQINPKNIRLYGNGGTVMSETVLANELDDLVENALYVHAAGTSFQQGDYVLFYANGPVKWSLSPDKTRFIHTNNYYEDYSYYFLNFDLGNGQRIAEENASGTAATIVTAFDDYRVVDMDSFNLGGIGKLWWSHAMNSINSASLKQNILLDLGSVAGDVHVAAQVANKNDANGNTLKISVNNQPAHSFVLGKQYTDYFSSAADEFQIQPNTPQLSIQLQYIPAGNGIAYLDYLRFNYKRPLSFSGGQMPFRALSTLSLSSGEHAEYQIQNANASLKLWDVTDPLKPVALSGDRSGGVFRFVREGHSLKELIAFDGSQFGNPKYFGPVANQNLHALENTDFLIISHQDFLAAAEELADFHRQRYGTKVTVVEVSKIFNEFSSGSRDIAGIRNFIKKFYDQAVSDEERIQNVLLFGAASYDYKDRISPNTNFVPTYQTLESSSETRSYSSDDFFALLDTDENMRAGFLDVGIGRIPVYTLEEAQQVVAKIKRYASPESFGPWKNVVSFVADDKEGGLHGMNHLNDCEAANAYFFDEGRAYNVYKIYEDAYPAVAGSGGIRYPAVNKAINDRIYLGTFLMSYSGHGSPTRWSHEAILTPADYNSWENKYKLPVIITATCDFGRFDDPNLRSAGAQLMLSPNSGAIAMITTTQAVYASGNTTLTKNFIKTQFTPKADGSFHSLGTALMKAKNQSGGGDNDHKFTVLGDPALPLQIPENKVVTDSILTEIDGEQVLADTIKSLGRYVLKGSVLDKNDQLMGDFNGNVFITIFDKKTTVQTVNTWPYTTPNFELQTNIIARIRAKAVNGRFSAPFLVPKDIQFDFGAGKISYYAHDEVKDAKGMDLSYSVGGFNPDAPEDNDPPLVKAYIDNDKFRDGGVTGPNPLLYVKLFDENGINVTGNSPGHDLVAILDEDIQNPMVMNDYYQTEENDYRKGYVYFPLYHLADGEHTIRVKAWDSYNNSGEGTVRFIVRNPDKGFISELYNYPNPVTDITHFRFQHNQKGEKMTVYLQIFNTSGMLMREIQQEQTPEGNSSEIHWDGLGTNGNQLARGVYPYRLIIKTEKGKTATAYQKLVLLR